MATQYTIPNDPITGEPSKSTVIGIDDDGEKWFIPVDLDNRMYQDYLKSLEV